MPSRHPTDFPSWEKKRKRKPTHRILQRSVSYSAQAAVETWISNCNSYTRVALIPIVNFTLWVYLITLNPNQDLLLCKKLSLMHSGTQKLSLMHSGTYLIRSWSDLSCWLSNPSKSLQSFSLESILSSNGADNFSGLLQALETQPFYSSAKEKILILGQLKFS